MEFSLASAQRCVKPPRVMAASQATYIQDQEKTALHSATVPILHEKADKKEDGLFEGEVEIHEQYWLVDRVFL